ncbi:carbon-nitrogen hydrolase family protein [Antrihabitans sp. YC3-6]|uniref:Carbon-nitrogen hydrolase family protein n=1 Tax=Antrihabitans stalagmiti TaxID=2799499 RepID=A0A934NQ97_9NOCA|nr:carbon-nitrogen hydrolase family protein [Antrihabitans stalagmiti]MBJ8339446.1 carbon-nitrogen hydrolase family protein [Antrihabitans stalagmiti]
MPRNLPLTAVQAPPRLIGEPFSQFAEEATRIRADQPDTRLIVFPELHLFGDGQPDQQRADALRAAAEPLDGPLLRNLRQLAGDLGVWLIPGSVCESAPGGMLFNTAVVLSPEGEVAASYRKIFPWRPYEPYDPGNSFVTVELPGIGRVGLSICYDAWFPETSRHLAWMGADVIVNIVKTTTPDRAQEVVLARANAIVNQVFMVSLNCAAPPGAGRSLIVDPEGFVLSESENGTPTTLFADLDLTHVDRVRANGTAGYNRMWSQFGANDAPIDMPLYAGRIDPATWTPAASDQRSNR